MKVIHQPPAKTQAERRVRDTKVREVYDSHRRMRRLPAFAVTKGLDDECNRNDDSD